MKQVSQNYKTGAVRLEEVNAPQLKAGGVLVQTRYSVISAGTEGMKVREGKMSYLGKARARPDQVKKVLHTLRQLGPRATYEKVMTRLDTLTPLGYSLSGIVLQVGPGVEEFKVGQRVACAGGGYANHAELNFVPKNLVVPVPDGVDMKHAAFATLGAIAMHGFRQAEMQLGETAAVIGLGLIGQLLVQILRAARVNVIGIDIVPARCDLALAAGAAAAAAPGNPALRMTVDRLTDGMGVDTVFVTAGGASNGPVELAVALARDRARVVDIGKTRLDLPWKDYYEKELDVRFSRSYGPGRYDPNYEERGIDYPIGYVRWTERRNMASFLKLLEDGELNLDAIISGVYPFNEAQRVYEGMAGGGLGVVFEYPEQVELVRRLPTLASGASRRPAPAGKARIGVIGAGNYARSVLLPQFARNPDARLVEVATASSLSAADAARRFGFERTSTDHRSLLEADDIDAVVIATRHASHARFVAEALRAGKAVFVEKPLAIDLEGLQMVRQAIEESGNRALLVGFNRRYSPLVRRVRDMAATLKSPLTLAYRVHAGQMEHGSWYLDPSEGSRFVGEAGHFLDVMAFLADARPVSVYGVAINPPNATRDDGENLSTTVSYEDGSVGTLLYLTQGGSGVPKEYLEVFGGGATAQLDNFESLLLFQGDARQKAGRGGNDKGHRDEVNAFVAAVKEGRPMPISLSALFDTTLTTLAAAASVRAGRPIALGDFWTEI